MAVRLLLTDEAWAGQIEAILAAMNIPIAESRGPALSDRDVHRSEDVRNLARTGPAVSQQQTYSHEVSSRRNSKEKT